MYDIKIYESGQEKETIRGLSIAQASTLQKILDRHDIAHRVKRIEAAQQPATLPPAAKLPETCPQCAGELYNGYCQNCKATFEYAASAVHCWSTCSFKYTGIHETGCPAARPAQTGKG
jgi:hypothetical protein